MEILTGILCLLQIANMVFNLRGKLEVSKEDKKLLGETIHNIGVLVDSVADDLEKNIYPHSKCYQMELYANEFKAIVKGKVSEQDMDKLVNLLNESLKVERLLGEMNNISLESKDKNIELLHMAASSFKTSAEILQLK